jgi:transposase
VSDDLWELVQPLLPKKERRFRYPGRRRLPERETLHGILFVLHTGISWTHLPRELGFGSGITCWRRLDEWQKAVSGWSCTRCCAETGPSPVDRGRAGSKHHLLVDATGIPLAWSVTGGNRNDVTQLIPLVDAVPAVRGTVGRPPKRPERLTADRGYDHDKYRSQLRQRGSHCPTPGSPL